MKHYDAILHVRGESKYVDDVTPPADMLHAAIFSSPVAHGKILSVDVSAALASAGVVAVFTGADVPGENQVGSVIKDQPLLADKQVCYQGEPVVLVVAESFEQALAAAAKVRMEVEKLEVIVDPRVAYERGEIIGVPRTFEKGDLTSAWRECHTVVQGRADVAGQEHLYLETQRARAVPCEGGKIRVYSSTQGPYAVQATVASVLGVAEHQIEVDVRRLGGGFGGKEDQATAWGCMVALACSKLNRPVELVLNRIDDMKMTGKRHPYSADYKIGADENGKIIAYEVQHYQNAGASCDLSLAVLERTLFHSTNSYNIPHVKASAASCRTNLPPNTAFRGFGGPQGMFAIESAIAELAEVLGMTREEIQYINLIKDGDVFSYGQTVENSQVRRTWDEAISAFDYAAMRKSVDEYNATHRATKKGLAIMPITFGISFTATFLNQASALVHIYTDGSVGITTGGIEMGQGFNTKIVDIAARQLGISNKRIHIESTNTTRVANMSPSAASATTDLNGGATILATNEILGRFRKLLSQEMNIQEPEQITIVDEQVLYRGEPTGLDWVGLVKKAYFARVALSSHAFYATPNVWFDKAKESGRPFAYYSYGTAIVQVTVDCLRGDYEFDTVRLVHDLGRPINELVDLGQIEGGLAQGLGWMTLEELAYNEDGRLTSNALSTYKAPDGFYMPQDLQIKFLENSDNDPGPLGSKAVGEPPLMYGLGAFFAIREAIRAFNGQQEVPFDAPMTPEKTLRNLHGERLREIQARGQAKASVKDALAAARRATSVVPGE